MHKTGILLYVLVSVTGISCSLYTDRPIPFNKIIWNAWDITFDEQRYNMALWLFKENWFTGKTKEILLNELFENKKTNHIERFYNENGDEHILLFDLRYSNEFMERWNIDFDFKPIAYLKLYFNENSQIHRAELLKGNRRMNVKEYKIIRYWETR